MKTALKNFSIRIKNNATRRRLRFDLLSSFFLMQLVTVLSISTFMHNIHTSSLLDTSKVLMKNVSRDKVETIMHRFDRVNIALSLGAHVIDSDADVNLTNKTVLTFMKNYLKHFPYMDSVFFALKKGYFFHLLRVAPKTEFKTIPGRLLPKNVVYAIRTIQYYEKSRTEKWHYVDSSFKIIQEEILPESEVSLNFYAREWYKNAIDLEAFSWSNVYVLSVTQLPGVAASFPVKDTKGEVIGVIGSDMHLRTVSQILQENSFDGVSMIVNKDGGIIAHPKQLDTAKSVSNEIKLMMLTQAPEKYIATAYNILDKTKENMTAFSFENQDYIVLLFPFANNLFKEWLFVSVAPVDVFISTVKEAQTKVFYISICILVFSTFLIAYMTLGISRPIHLLVTQADKIRGFDLSPVPIVHSGIVEIQKLQESIFRMRRSLEAFGKFVPKNLVKLLIEKDSDVKIGGKKKRITLFFSDIEGFTSISESASADKLMLHLSEYFDELSRIIINQQGTIDKYIGDAIMAFWGAPNMDSKHALHACQAALFCQKRLIDLNRKWIYDKKSAFNTRIGIHTGDVIVGNLGSSERMNYTVIGDSVNLAARLEGVNKQYGTKIIISESVLKEVGDQAIVRPLDIVSVKGKKQGVPIYELVAITGADPYLLPTNDELDLCYMFQKAFKHYYEQRWDDAIEIFDRLILRFPADLPSQMYLMRCHDFKINPPGKDWDHTHHMKDK